MELKNTFVNAQIEKCNPWYVGSHFEWAAHPSVRRIYEKRFKYFSKCIHKMQKKLKRNLRLLDAGCGDGYWLLRLSEIDGLDLTGVDYNVIRIERAKQVAPSIRLLVGDLACLEKQEPFDIVLLNQVIEHVKEDRRILELMRNLLNENGVLILGTPNEGGFFQQRKLRKTGEIEHTDHVHFYTEKEIAQKIQGAGFRIDSVMREVFYVGNDRLYYWLTARDFGYKFLDILTRLFPRGCSDFYFECYPV